ncbi:heat shock [Trichoderma arundinaceum]|uniref:Heat shock n=1 Tax=Trichoderma arundinaceum TaxID=490622 RepID=A0A395NRM3_TRIAR|nr:heat shock [Trichoderma arundinaceum]
MAPQRDYYADLGLPPTADVVDIKKQFRKLALKYHPDRNPGREQEVNSQFQIIQAAHEILSDADAKAKYDAACMRSAGSRYPASSGVRGNPWQNVSQQFPVPPRRNPPRTTTSGAQRWNERFSAGVPPTAKQHASAATAARAFESMRKGGAKSGQQDRPAPPPPPPRTEGAKKRAEASFGAKKTGYYPRSNTPGDEPPVTNNNYSSRINTERPEPVPDPLAPFREKSRGEESFADPRQSSPYTRTGGEKTNPFDSIPLNRAKSAREPARQEEPPAPADPPTPKRRSSSMPRKETRDGAQRGEDEMGVDGRQRVVPVPPSSRPAASFKARTEAATAATPNGNIFTANQQANPFTANESARPSSNHMREQPASLPLGLKSVTNLSNPAFNPAFNAAPPPVNGVGGPSMYAVPQKDEPSSSLPCHSNNSTSTLQINAPTNRNFAEVGLEDKQCIPSGTHSALHNLSPFEQKQYHILKCLIKNREKNVLTTGNKLHQHHSTTSHHKTTFAERSSANDVLPTSFSFNLDEDTFAPNPPGTARFRKSSSADGINTNFVKDENSANSATWQFSAGSGDNESLPQGRSQSGNKANRRSPIKRRPVPNAEVPESGAQPPQNPTGFDAEGWSTKFGPQTFVPHPVTPNMSGSPTRPGRANTRKTRTIKPMAGNAAMVGDSSSEDDLYDWRGRKSHQKAATVDSPQAMDIDPPLAASPAVTPIPTPPPLVPTAAPAVAATAASTAAPAKTPTPPSQPQHQPQPPPMVARNIPVEPSRPEWRPGNVTGLGQVYEQPEERKEIPVHFQGSEDTEEFRATFEDLKNVAPFAPSKPGLKSFDDLKDSLPFESQASAEIHLNVPHPHPLVFPEPPVAPRLPPTVAVDGVKPNVASWSKYLEEFESYLRRWDIFNSQVVDHFATRKSNISHVRASKGYSFLGVRGDADVLEYHNWVEQDNGVRKRWVAACEEHEKRFTEFMAFREKMK